MIEQIRELSEKMALTPQYGGAQIVILDPADAINHAACNALLKTLEEPHPGRYLWLISANPARLPATIRSRCQRLEMRLPPQQEAFACFAPGPANQRERSARFRAWAPRTGRCLAARRVAWPAPARSRDLAKLARGDLAVVETAQRWTADEHAAMRLRHAADLALMEAAGLTDATRTRTLATWFDAANRTRDLLRTTVRADLAVAELLMAWRGKESRSSGLSGSGGRG